MAASGLGGERRSDDRPHPPRFSRVCDQFDKETTRKAHEYPMQHARLEEMQYDRSQQPKGRGFWEAPQSADSPGLQFAHGLHSVKERGPLCRHRADGPLVLSGSYQCRVQPLHLITGALRVDVCATGVANP